ncbi:hypothetical protein M5D96_005707, partial [Drosophila gunungcola]
MGMCVRVPCFYVGLTTTILMVRELQDQVLLMLPHIMQELGEAHV